MPTSQPSSVQPDWIASPYPGQYVNSVGISADGSLVVAGTYFHTYDRAQSQASAASAPFTVGVVAWDTSGAELWQDVIPDVTEGVYWVAVSRNGSTAASGGLISAGKGFIYAYDAQTGARTLSHTLNRRANMVALSDDGTRLAAAGDKLYLFWREGSVWRSSTPLECPDAGEPGDSYYVAVALSFDGNSIAACTNKGSIVFATVANGVVSPPTWWKLPSGDIYGVSMAADGSGFAAAATVVAEGQPDAGTVFYFDTARFTTTETPQWSGRLQACKNCRSVAVRDDGQYVSAVGTLEQLTLPQMGGAVFLFRNGGDSGQQVWMAQTYRDPNSTSMDSRGSYITCADGYPDASPGKPSPGFFYLFDAAGDRRWCYETSNMSWPMQISASANAIAAGSDDSKVYYFTAGLPAVPELATG
jgi:WD40 repeat protein